ncbi:Os01g0115200 [Oryza sativa Japonica Group]|uniref:Os01g0115200 protein n=1 Tax=Oryza sativa subsp. japonica TaxID=39947 RepID=A0A0P0UXE0_ORYSJ|nr:Os01g0115200 [Oryza sativa Japonica Group]
MILIEKTKPISLLLNIPIQSLQSSQLLHSRSRRPPRPTTSSVRRCLSPGKITRLNALLHAVIEIEVNSDALQQPARADTEHASGHSYCGPLHGVPILKDNIVKRDRLNTTAGSFALLGSVVCRDAGVTAGLRAAAAAAIILSKANPVPNGWSARRW